MESVARRKTPIYYCGSSAIGDFVLVLRAHSPSKENQQTMSGKRARVWWPMPPASPAKRGARQNEPPALGRHARTHEPRF